MKIKFLKEVVTIIVGKPAEKIVDLLFGKKNVNEFIIANKLEYTINQTRNILYKLSDYGLVSSIRKKDKKKGWYTYFWKIEVLKSLEFLRSFLEKAINQNNNKIKSRESKLFYYCERCDVELNEENAMLNNFTCNECGSVFKLKDNSKIIKDLKRSKDKLSKQLVLVNDEIKKELEKEEKKRLIELKKSSKKKIVKKMRKKKEKKSLKKVKSKKIKKKKIKKPFKKSSKLKNVLRKKKSIKKTEKKLLKKFSKQKVARKKLKKKPKNKSVKKIKKKSRRK